MRVLTVSVLQCLQPLCSSTNFRIISLAEKNGIARLLGTARTAAAPGTAARPGLGRSAFNRGLGSAQGPARAPGATSPGRPASVSIPVIPVPVSPGPGTPPAAIIVAPAAPAASSASTAAISIVVVAPAVLMPRSSFRWHASLAVVVI